MRRRNGRVFKARKERNSKEISTAGDIISLMMKKEQKGKEATQKGTHPPRAYPGPDDREGRLSSSESSYYSDEYTSSDEGGDGMVDSNLLFGCLPTSLPPSASDSIGVRHLAIS